MANVTIKLITENERDKNMIIAILEDKKRFRSSIAMPDYTPYVRIPIPVISQLLYDPIIHKLEGEIFPPSMEVIEFHFDKWLEKNKVALYKEKS